ncbi:hypothetical protein ACWKTZ_20180 [Bacillus cereus]
MKKKTFLLAAVCTSLLFGCDNKEIYKELNKEKELQTDKKQINSTSNSKEINTCIPALIYRCLDAYNKHS